MKYIAHRGYSIRYKDNSIQAIYEAVERGYDGIEIDIQQCKTGEIVLYHDVYIDGQFIEDMTFDELRSKGVCSLKRLYNTIPSIRRIRLFLDIKGESSFHNYRTPTILCK
jgi:glycerophosphoryl diester phosphodiesterase